MHVIPHITPYSQKSNMATWTHQVSVSPFDLPQCPEIIPFPALEQFLEGFVFLNQKELNFLQDWSLKLTEPNSATHALVRTNWLLVALSNIAVAMGLLRSEPMKHGTLVVPVDRAREFIDLIGAEVWCRKNSCDLRRQKMHVFYLKCLLAIRGLLVAVSKPWSQAKTPRCNLRTWMRGICIVHTKSCLLDSACMCCPLNAVVL